MLSDLHLRPKKFRPATCLSSLALLATFFGSDAYSEEIPPLGALVTHDHRPIQVRSRPVIERLPVKVIDPVDLVVSDAGNVYVADRRAECVFRLDQQGSVSLMVEHLQNISRIQLDAHQSVYVMTSSGGESGFYQVTASGQKILIKQFSFPCKAFVRDEIGRFLLAVENSGRLVSMSPDGVITELVQLGEPVLDLILNAGGQTEALLPSGQVALISEDGRVNVSGYAKIGSTRLASLSDGTLLSLSGSDGTRGQVVHVCRDGQRPDQFEVAANVPAGTRAAGFDSLGNLCLANPDLRAITKVTSQFRIPCPHCGKPTRMIFSSDADPADGADFRSF